MKPTAAEIADFITDTLATHPDNVTEKGYPYFEPPLVGFADAGDPLFESYKKVIGTFHQTPAEVFEKEYGTPLEGGSVISWVMPISKHTRKDNSKQMRFPSRSWAHTRDFGQQFINKLTTELVEWLATRGVRAAVPTFAMRNDPQVGFASDWSERHAAYAAGLGTFSLNDALITERGIAHRLSSVVIDLPLTATPRIKELYDNCLYYAKDKCGKCRKRCPAEAISKKGHDKNRCKNYCYGAVMEAVGEEYGVAITGCGLCQTAVPCESRNPVKP